jgi:hypothetical protein
MSEKPITAALLNPCALATAFLLQIELKLCSYGGSKDDSTILFQHIL